MKLLPATCKLEMRRHSMFFSPWTQFSSVKESRFTLKFRGVMEIHLFLHLSNLWSDFSLNTHTLLLQKTVFSMGDMSDLVTLAGMMEPPSGWVNDEKIMSWETGSISCSTSKKNFEYFKISFFIQNHNCVKTSAFQCVDITLDSWKK